nr:hypothetical protein [Bacteroides luti]
MELSGSNSKIRKDKQKAQILFFINLQLMNEKIRLKKIAHINQKFLIIFIYAYGTYFIDGSVSSDKKELIYIKKSPIIPHVRHGMTNWINRLLKIE